MIGPDRICIHTDTGRSYTIRRIAAQPQVYVAYYRNAADEREEYLHREGRTFEAAMQLVTDHIQDRVGAVVQLKMVP